VTDLAARLAAAQDRLRAATAGTAAEPAAAALVARLAEPPRVALVGTVKAGKSTLLNGLLGQHAAPTDSGERTLVVTWYRHGVTYRALVERHDGDVRQVPMRRTARGTEPDLAGVDLRAVRRLVVEWPAPLLRRVTLVDTPGLDSLTAEVSARTEHLLEDDGDAPEVDALLVVTPHVHPRDVRLLAAFQDRLAGAAAPGHSIAVLSRADDVAGGAPAAMDAAAQAARRLVDEAHLGRFCQAVVPVAGLLAEGSATADEPLVDALRALAGHAPAELDRLLRSADALDAAGYGAAVRAVGMFGVGVAVELLRREARTASSALVAALSRASGIRAVAELLDHRIVGRADVLRLRALLAGLRAVGRTADPPTAAALARLEEELAAGAHELVEHQLVTALRREALPVDEAEAAEIERLLDDPVAPLWARLGLSEDPGAEAVRAHLAAAISRWSGHAAHPLATAPRRQVAEAVRRSLEALAAAGG
jgi:hypothetical protein